MHYFERSYLGLLLRILTTGKPRGDRTGTGTVSLFGAELPLPGAGECGLLRSKYIHARSVRHELAWFLNGDTNARTLESEGVRIWSAWADENGDLGPIYGAQLRGTGPNGGPDQWQDFIEGLRSNPESRRHIITLWQPRDLADMALPPCHGVVIQGYVERGALYLQVYQRSADMFLGVPFNLASYHWLGLLAAELSGLAWGGGRIVFGDAHVYNNHADAVKKQLSNAVDLAFAPGFAGGPAPVSIIRPGFVGAQVHPDAFGIVGKYQHKGRIKAPVSV